MSAAVRMVARLPGQPASAASATQTLRVVSLGDSVSSGDGVGVVTPPERTWSALLAAWLAPVEHTSLAVAGAKAADVRAHQLDRAVALRPHLATLCVGLNDLVKTGCGPALREDLRALVAGLRETGATAVVTRLHDPAAVFRMPRRLAAQVAGRVRIVNAALDAAAAGDPGVVLVDLDPLTSTRCCWAVDRVHPSAWGQLVLARRAADRLGLVPPPLPGAAPQAPSGLAHAAWLLRSGLPWLTRRVGEVGPAVGGMALRAAREAAGLA